MFVCRLLARSLARSFALRWSSFFSGAVQYVQYHRACVRASVHACVILCLKGTYARTTSLSLSLFDCSEWLSVIPSVYTASRTTHAGAVLCVVRGAVFQRGTSKKDDYESRVGWLTIHTSIPTYVRTAGDRQRYYARRWLHFFRGRAGCACVAATHTACVPSSLVPSSSSTGRLPPLTTNVGFSRRRSWLTQHHRLLSGCYWFGSFDDRIHRRRQRRAALLSIAFCIGTRERGRM